MANNIFSRLRRPLQTSVRRSWQRMGRPDNLAQRAEFAERVRQAAGEDRFVCIVYDGMDCDGVSYSGSKDVVRATPVHVNRAIERYGSSADGPFSWSILSLTDADRVRYESRDLGLEAFENGHPHVLRSATLGWDRDHDNPATW